MNIKTVEEIIRKSLNGFREVEFVWHGSEPLIRDLDFYEKALRIQDKYKDPQNKVTNTLQTNGTLITEEYANFFEKNNITPGISIDGPKEIHNKTRIYKNGKGTFEDVMKGVKTLKEKDIHPGAIMVATQYSKNKEEEIYSFFKENKINFRVDPVFLGKGEWKKNKGKLLLSSREVGELWINLFDLWFNDKDFDIEIHPFKPIIRGFLTGEVNDCAFQKDSCPHHLFFKPNGDVSVFGEWSRDAGMELGNIKKDSIQNLILSKGHLKIERREKLPEYHPDCKNCEWKELCYSGCPQVSYEMKGTIFEKDPFCEARKMLFKHIKSAIQEESIYA